MGTELMRMCVKEDNDDFPSVPPGFESFSSFSLKRVESIENKDDESMITCSASTSITQALSVKSEMDGQGSDDAKNHRSLRRKPWINYGQYDYCSDEESDFEQRDQNFHSRPCLPKGVIRGCPECNNCQKIVAQWKPENARRPNLEDAPIFFPTEEEFEDTLNYISSIRERAEPYGICRIVPPPSWNPPCPLKEKNIWEHSTFSTRIQRIDKLQNRNSMKKLSKSHNMRKKRRCITMGLDCGIGGALDVENLEAERFGFEPGPDFTLGVFERYAGDFKARYFRKNESFSDIVDDVTTRKVTWEPSLEDFEGEYWRMVEKPTEEIEVLYGADLDTGVFGSGFPTRSGELSSATDEKYLKSGWNLNNFPRLPGSVLSYESSDISGVLVPWLYIGMCFSSFCWHVEDHHLYSLNYMHWGAPKMWYGVPGKDACKLEEVMKKHLPDLFEEQPDLLHKLVTQLSPTILKSDGVPVYRCVQNPGEFVLTFPRAYHSGFNCGFNCAEAVNVAPVDWLPYGLIAVELYREQGRRTSISHDKLLLGAARDAVRAHWELNLLKKNTLNNLRWKDFCGKDGILAKALKSRVEMERVSRELLCNSSQALKMDNSFDANNERECSVCLFDLHLSAAGCHCCSDRYACLSHAKQFCSCPWDSKFFLFRYNVSELNILVEALEGKLSAVYRWARLYLGLALTSYVSRDHTQLGSVSQSSVETTVKESGSNISTSPDSSQSTVQKEDSPLPSSVSVKDHQLVHVSKEIAEISTRKPDESSGCQEKVANKNSHAKKEESASSTSNLRPQGCQFSQSTSCSSSHALEVPELKKGSGSGLENVIHLSDDEGEEAMFFGADAKIEPLERVASSSDNSKPLNNEQQLIFAAPVKCAASMCEKNDVSLHDEKMNSLSTDPVNKELHQEISLPDVSCNLGSVTAKPGRHIEVSTRETSDCRKEISENGPQNAPQASYMKPYMEKRNEKLGACANSNLVENVREFNANASCSNNIDRNQRQGLRIARVIRRMDHTVEPIEYGVVLSGKSWCNIQAIYPKGFRSRVRYTSVLDPTKMCYYVSEIMEAPNNGPLFMVSVEHCPSEVFIHISASRCWNMVREKINQEIAKQHRLGKVNLPALMPPGSVDGFEMFGFSSPKIVQAIEAMDRNLVCAEYWNSRPHSLPQPQSTENSQDNHGNQPSFTGSGLVLRGLLRKANQEELNAFYNILSEKGLHQVQSLIMQLLQEELDIRGR